MRAERKVKFNFPRRQDKYFRIAVVLSNGWGGKKWMEVGKPHNTFYDLTEHIPETVTTNEYGWVKLIPPINEVGFRVSCQLSVVSCTTDH